jgi:hypothetical protein
VFASIGLEGEVSPPSHIPGPNTWRVMTLYAGIGFRRALVDVDPEAAAAAVPPFVAGPCHAPPAEPWELMLTVDLDFAINSQLWIW